MYTTFHFKNYTFSPETGTLALSYSLDDTLFFTEEITFPTEGVVWANVSQEALEKAFRAMHLMAGISYWKTYCPKEMIFENTTLSSYEARFWTEVYTKGLGEFFYRNQIDFRGLINFPSVEGKEDTPSILTLPSKSLVAIGGGKDSLVSAELLLEHEEDFTLFSVHEHKAIRETAEIVGKPWMIVKRKLSANIQEINDRADSHNGHIPITAYNSFVMLIMCLLHGFDSIILSIEKSADSGNLLYHDLLVNHQYSKSFDFEKIFDDFVKTTITPHIHYCSLLRPLYELKIGELFAKYNGYQHRKFVGSERSYLDSFASCNANFKLLSEKSKSRWCGVCPKCAFVFANLGPFFPKKVMEDIFEQNLFASTALLETYRELLGISGHKPFECVGTVEEIALAFYYMYQSGEYKGDLIMDMFEKEVLPQIKDITALEKEVMSIYHTDTIPERMRSFF